MSESEEERRPRPIGVADESEEGESDTERNGAASAGAADGPGTTTGEAAPEETAAKKPSKKMPAFSENDLVKDKGLRQIYKDFPQKCRYKGKGREVRVKYGSRIQQSSKFENSSFGRYIPVVDCCTCVATTTAVQQ